MSAGSAVNIDMASVLAKLQQVEREKQQLTASLQNANGRLTKFQEAKRVEMEEIYNNVMAKWLQHLKETKASDGEVIDTFNTGLVDLAKQGDENGVWNLIACASSNWAANVNEIEGLRTRLNGYEEKERELAKHASGTFAVENSRIEAVPSAVGGEAGSKRKAGGISQQPNDIWGDFKSMIMSQGGNLGEDYSEGGIRPSGQVNLANIY